MALRERQILDPPETVPGPGVPVPQRAQPWVCWAVIAGSVAMMLLDKRFMTPVYDNGELIGELQLGALFGPLVKAGEWWPRAGLS